MGNVLGDLTEEEESMLIEEAINLSLDNPDSDKILNAGTTAPNCQPKGSITTTDSSSDSSSGGDADGNNTNENQSNNSNRNSASSNSNNRRSSKNKMTEEERKLSYMQMARIGYQELVNAIIRPPRAEYKMEALGPPAFNFCGRRFTRTDFALKTKRGMNLQCSHWEPVQRESNRIPCLIYMHGNSSARVEVIPQLSYLLSLGLAVFSFDFAGSGKSDGEYVSLGYYEREDLMCVVAHLRATKVVSTIALWGRSMGAATALMHGDRDPSIACMILDSPFADLTQLAEEMVEKGRDQGINVPNLVVSFALRMIKGSVKRQANFDIRCISPIAHADKCFIPALFVAGEHDDFINKCHSQAIHARYAGDKNIIIVEGDHNSPRPKFMFDSVSIFLQTCLQIPNSWALKVHPSMNLMAPPWLHPGPPPSSSRGLRRGYSNSENSRKSNSMKATTKVQPPSRQNSAPEMGMTAERQREIQASLFRMLGQADEQQQHSEQQTIKQPSSRKKSDEVAHASTFPPEGVIEDASSEDYEEKEA